MSKISGDRSEALNQLKDLYAQKERESETRHKEEINSLRSTHAVQTEKLRQENEERLEKTRDEAATKLNQKDLQYRKEIESVRAMYAKRVAESKKA